MIDDRLATCSHQLLGAINVLRIIVVRVVLLLWVAVFGGPRIDGLRIDGSHDEHM